MRNPLMYLKEAHHNGRLASSGLAQDDHLVLGHGESTEREAFTSSTMTGKGLVIYPLLHR